VASGAVAAGIFAHRITSLQFANLWNAVLGLAVLFADQFQRRTVMSDFRTVDPYLRTMRHEAMREYGLMWLWIGALILLVTLSAMLMIADDEARVASNTIEPPATSAPVATP
jgi:hypothetical protein